MDGEYGYKVLAFGRVQNAVFNAHGCMVAHEDVGIWKVTLNCDPIPVDERPMVMIRAHFWQIGIDQPLNIYPGDFNGKDFYVYIEKFDPVRAGWNEDFTFDVIQIR